MDLIEVIFARWFEMRFIDHDLFFKDHESFWVHKDVVRNGHEGIVGSEVCQIIRGSNHQNYDVFESRNVKTKANTIIIGSGLPQKWIKIFGSIFKSVVPENPQQCKEVYDELFLFSTDDSWETMTKDYES